ncbi:MAG: hypothetical protein Q9M37_01945 [Desulfonauticus sp.]|nr:hypothetical protein [Desulfonauticus sp.]
MNVLIYLDDNLISSISLRYICAQARFVPMSIRPFHVEVRGQRHYPFGVGWVRRTWENTVKETSREFIENFIKTEIHSCPGLLTAKIVVGDTETELLKEIKTGKYDLFVIGMLRSFGFYSFYDFLNGSLIKQIKLPILLVRNITHYKSVYFLIDRYTDVHAMLQNYFSLYKDLPYNIFFCHYAYNDQETNEFKNKLIKIKDCFKDFELDISKVIQLPTSVEESAHLLRTGDMVVASIEKNGAKTAITDILANIPNSCLIFWK